MPSLDVFFSEYVEGSGNNKALEIYNGTTAPINLAIGNYVIQTYFNGNTVPTQTFALTGTVAVGDVYVLALNNGDPLTNSTLAAILAQADQTTTSQFGWYNGNDAIVLRKGGTGGQILDSIGQIGFDPGTEWGTGLISTADNTLRRNRNVTDGDPNPNDIFDPSLQWEGFAQNNVANLGSHYAAPILNNSGSPTLIPIDEDISNSSNTGTSLASLISGLITDINNDPLGIAVTGADNTNGNWQYSLNGGSIWTPFVANLSDTNATVFGPISLQPIIRFVPNQDYFGTTPSLTFRAWDTTDNLVSGTTGVNVSINGSTSPFSSDSETATITINPVNDAPSFIKGPDRTVGRNSGAQTFPGWATAISSGSANESTQTVSFQVVGNDNSALFSVPPAIDPSGQLTFTPAAGATGTANITLNITDNGGTANGGVDTSADRTFVINVINNSPIGNLDTYNTRPNQVLNVSVADGVLANDTDSNGDSLTANLLTNPSSGTLSFNNDGSFSYTPNSGFVGTDSFTYSVSDGVAAVPATVNINVTNSRPIALDDIYNTIHGKVLNVPVASGVLTNDSDSDGDLLTANLVTNPSNGSIALNSDGSFSYTPNPGFAGLDSFTYSASDGVETVQTVASINVTNSQPIALIDTYNTPHDRVLNVPVADGVLANDSDSDRDLLTANLVTNPSNGSIALNSDGSFSYTPNPGFAGLDSFTYSASDGVATAQNIANINVTNSLQIALIDTYNTPHDKVLNVPVADGVLANDSDSDRDLLTANLVTNPSNGSIALNSDGSFSYTPNPGFAGLDSFTYSASDGVETVQTVASINVTNSQPIALIDTYNTPHDRVLNVPVADGVLANDSDSDGDLLTANLVTNPSNGSIALNSDGSFSYTPNPGFVGIDSFTYSASDGVETVQNIANINVTNSLPIALIDDYNTLEGQTLNVPVATGVLANDSDLDGDFLTANLVTITANGTLNFNSDGSFSYTPNRGFSGLDSFTYNVGDGAGGVQSTANINVIKAGTFNFNATNYRVDENGGFATISVTRADADRESAVSYSSSDGSAIAPGDYDRTSGTLTFGIGETSQSFTVQIIDDSEIEGDENVNLSLKNPTNGFELGAVSSAVLTIVDTTPTPTPEPTPTPTPTPSETPTPTPSGSPSPTHSGSPNPTPSGSPSPTPLGSPNPTPSGSPNPTPSGSPSPTPSGSPSPTPSGSPTPTPSGSPNPTPSRTPSPNPMPSGSPSPTPSGSPSPNPTPSGSPSPTPSESPTPSGNPSPTPSGNPSPTPSGSPAGAGTGAPPLQIDGETGTPAGAGTGAPPLQIDGETGTPVGADTEATPLQIDGETGTSVGTGTGAPPLKINGERPTSLPVAAAEDCICDRLNLPDRASIINPNIAENSLTGTDGRDNLTGSNTNDNINGLNGSDLLIGLFGNDNIYGGLASNIPVGSDADSDTIFGNENNDYILGHAGNDIIYAGKDDDRAIAGKDSDLIWGDKGSDTLLGDAGDDSLFGGTSEAYEGDLMGKDLLFGDSGSDVVYGEESEDTLAGGDGSDTVQGGKDSDLICGDAGSDLLFGDLGSDTICGGDGDDTIFGDNDITATDNSSEQDYLCGGSGSDLIFGNEDADRLCGGDGSDTLYGGKGDDSLTGGTGDDWLVADAGNNTLRGGSDRDYFVLNATDGGNVIADFTKGEDLLVLTEGLTFDRLRIVQENNATLIGIAGTNRVLAVLNGVQASAIGHQDFTVI